MFKFVINSIKALSNVFMFSSAVRSSDDYLPFVQAVNQEALRLKQLDQQSFNKHIYTIRSHLYANGLTDELLIQAFAMIKCACQTIYNITPYDTQILAARIMLAGRLAEMATGEGKTLASGIAACCAAMTGKPVHLLTANDYLAARDAEFIKPLASALGMNVAAVIAGMDKPERKLAYACNITYSTAKEVAFDYLRDSLETQHFPSEQHLQVAQLSNNAPQTVLRTLSYALIDEADSLLIDEAVTPLIISSMYQNTEQLVIYEQALSLARHLILNEDFLLNETEKIVKLTSKGTLKLNSLARQYEGVWLNQLYCQELAQMALSALYLYQLNRDYLISNDEVKVIDVLTGRVSEGRILAKGLHQMIALKEHLSPPGELTTLAQITFQRFFNEYEMIGGMSGTLKEASKELYDVYGLIIHLVPLHKPSQMQIWPTIAFAQSNHLNEYLITQIKHIHQTKRPILIGTDSVADSESLSLLLKQQNLPHLVLNARQNNIEASIVKAAGQLGRITIATNMAGRGTDIEMTDEVTEIGGLHVISCQHNQARRVDRQLIGRTARQGRQGSVQILFCLSNFAIYQSKIVLFNSYLPQTGLLKPQWLVKLLFNYPKYRIEHDQRLQRKVLLTQDLMEKKQILSI